MKNVFGVVTFFLISTSVVASLKGIPDSEDKAYLYEKGDYKCLSHKTLPKGLSFMHTLPSKPQLFAYSEDTTKCPYVDLFNMSRSLPKPHYVHIYIRVERPFEYWFHEECFHEDGRLFFAHWWYQWSIMENVDISCSMIENDDFTNVNYAVITAVSNGTCNFWLCLGRPEVIKPLHPPYPMYTVPTDKGNYYLSTDPLPADLQATDDGMAIDIFKASQTTYTVHKTAQRPIQIIDITTCNGVTISMDFDGTCTISIEPTISKLYYYVNGERRVIEYQPKEFLITFTYSTAYLYTFGPLGIYTLNGCTFDSSHASNADYTLKVRYDKSQRLPCEVAKLRFLEPVAVKRWKTATTLATTTVTAATTIAPTEPVVTKRPTSTASTTKWAIVAVGCFAMLIVVIVAALLLIQFLKKL